jgi:hypothetical protein
MLLMRSSCFPGRKVTSWSVPFWTSAKLASDSCQSRYLCAGTRIQSYRQLAMIECHLASTIEQKSDLFIVVPENSLRIIAAILVFFLCLRVSG